VLFHYHLARPRALKAHHIEALGHFHSDARLALDPDGAQQLAGDGIDAESDICAACREPYVARHAINAGIARVKLDALRAVGLGLSRVAATQRNQRQQYGQFPFHINGKDISPFHQIQLFRNDFCTGKQFFSFSAVASHF